MSRLDPTKLDDLLLSRVRLGILSALAGGDELGFTFLRDSLGLTDGNLSVQMRKLEDARYLTIRKIFVDQKPKTFCRISPEGRGALVAFVKNLAGVLEKG